MSEYTPHRSEAKSGKTLHYIFDNHLSSRLPPGHAKLSMAIDYVSHSRVLHCHQPEIYREIEANKKYKPVARLSGLFPNRSLHHTNVSPSKH